MDELNVDHLLRLVQSPFLDLAERYGYDVASKEVSLANLLRIACIAEIEKNYELNLSMNLMKNCVVMTVTDDEGYTDIEHLDEITAEPSRELVFTDRSGVAHRAENISLYIACTARDCVSLGPENVILLEKISKSEDLFAEDGTLKRWPRKIARRAQVLDYISSLFEPGRKYHEGHIDQEIRFFHSDYALIRRALVSEGYFCRMKDGSSYWLTEKQNSDREKI